MQVSMHFKLPRDEEKFLACLKGIHNKKKLESLYEEVFRPHIKYNLPILPSKNPSRMQELTQEQLDVIHALWNKVANHIYEKEEDL
jgi:hypothetical protein